MKRIAFLKLFQTAVSGFFLSVDSPEAENTPAFRVQVAKKCALGSGIFYEDPKLQDANNPVVRAIMEFGRSKQWANLSFLEQSVLLEEAWDYFNERDMFRREQS